MPKLYVLKIFLLYPRWLSTDQRSTNEVHEILSYFIRLFINFMLKYYKKYVLYLICEFIAPNIDIESNFMNYYLEILCVVVIIIINTNSVWQVLNLVKNIYKNNLPILIN